MRKTFYNRMYDELNHDLVKTQKTMGHANINSTVQSLSFREEEIDAAIFARAVFVCEWAIIASGMTRTTPNRWLLLAGYGISVMSIAGCKGRLPPQATYKSRSIGNASGLSTCRPCLAIR
jgi:hypothetical protein